MADTFKGIITADGKKRTFAREGITPEYVSDKTLSVDGGFADAKATGDVVKSLKQDIVPLEYDIYNQLNKKLNIERGL